MVNSNLTFQKQAYDFIKSQIMNLGFKPGEYITDSQIAGLLKISRTPVREAFYRLEKEGLLINEARRGWKIYTLSLDNINDIFDIKEVLEGMVARKAAACQDESLRSSLRDTFEKMALAAEANDVDAWLDADFHLHDILFQMAGNEIANRIITNLNEQWHRVRLGFVALQGRMQRSVDEHQSIIKSILDNDGEEAERLMQAHLNQVREELVHLLVSVVLPFADKGV
jgi:DNA-binding GntR family transcriptional regulator